MLNSNKVGLFLYTVYDSTTYCILCDCSFEQNYGLELLVNRNSSDGTRIKEPQHFVSTISSVFFLDAQFVEKHA